MGAKNQEDFGSPFADWRILLKSLHFHELLQFAQSEGIWQHLFKATDLILIFILLFCFIFVTVD